LIKSMWHVFQLCALAIFFFFFFFFFFFYFFRPPFSLFGVKPAERWDRESVFPRLRTGGDTQGSFQKPRDGVFFAFFFFFFFFFFFLSFFSFSSQLTHHTDFG